MTTNNAPDVRYTDKPSPDAALSDTSPRSTPALRYPFDRVPEPGELLPVHGGVHWLRMPLPFSGLDHINLYMIEGYEGWTIVDTGLRSAKIRSLWEEIFATALNGKPVKRIVVTHYHPDHIGQAGWLAARWGCRIHMTRTDFLYAKALTLGQFEEPPEEMAAFFRACGYDEAQMANWRERARNGFWKGVEPLPMGFVRLADRQPLRIGDSYWQIVVGRGHAPEHACLYNAECKMLLSGDQVLPRISSNISVYPSEPEADPLRDWIESCRMLPTRVADDALVLPAHNEPFYGLHARCADLALKHEKGLARLLERCREPRRVVDCFPALFKREIGDGVIGLATGETLAHLHYLLGEGTLKCTYDPAGVAWYVRV